MDPQRQAPAGFRRLVVEEHERNRRTSPGENEAMSTWISGNRMALTAEHQAEKFPTFGRSIPYSTTPSARELPLSRDLPSQRKSRESTICHTSGPCFTVHRPSSKGR